MPVRALAAVVLVALAGPAAAQLTPAQAVAEMGRGINLGNTLEPPREGAWNNGPAQESYFDAYVAAGFATVRVPVRWDEHTADAPPYAVDAAWMDRVEEVIGWGLERGLYVIVNAHHEDWLKQNYDDPALRARFDSIWVQIADRFQGASDRLLFEIINEPFGMTRLEVDDLNARVLGLIRRTNPTRLVIFSGHDYSNIPHLLAAAIPDPDDPYLVGYFHSYDPWQFAGLGQGTWGAAADRAVVRSRFQQVADWSAATGIPVVLSEFGAVRAADDLSRRVFLQTYIEEALRAGFAFQVWDDGGDFRVYNRPAGTWGEELTPLIHAFPDGPTDLQVDDDGPAALSWALRSEADVVFVERRVPGGTFETVAELAGGATSFVDISSVGGQTYRYRVVARTAGGTDKISYPVEVTVRLTERGPFSGTPTALPGTVQAEDFDEGGEGLTYHDTTPDNVPGAYRSGVAVDIEPRDGGGFQVTGVASGEWLEYTVDVAEAGSYDLATYVATVEGGGRLRVSVGDQRGDLLVTQATGDGQTLAPLVTTLTLPAGEQVLRLDVVTARPFNVDRIEVQRSGATATPEGVPDRSFRVFPNPARASVTVALGAVGGEGALVLSDVLGREVRRVVLAPETVVPVGDLAPGAYLLRAEVGGRVVGQRVVVKR